MMLPVTSGVNKSFDVDIGVSGFLDGEKDSDGYMGGKLSTFEAADALWHIGVFASYGVPILHVDGHRNVAQISKRVVNLVSVNVVDLPNRPTAVRHEPSEPMNSDLLFVNGALSIPVLNSSNDVSDCGFTLCDFPPKNPANGVIVEKLFSTRNADIVNFH